MSRGFNLLATRHSVAWLLSLVLLVPLAHVAALAHSYSHFDATASGQSDSDGKAPGHACEICLAAAALTGGALLAATAAPLVVQGPDLAPRHTDTGLGKRQPRLGYRSRAPPIDGL
jgi:hypothetical protein